MTHFVEISRYTITVVREFSAPAFSFYAFTNNQHQSHSGFDKIQHQLHSSDRNPCFGSQRKTRTLNAKNVRSSKSAPSFPNNSNAQRHLPTPTNPNESTMNRPHVQPQNTTPAITQHVVPSHVINERAETTRTAVCCAKRRLWTPRVNHRELAQSDALNRKRQGSD